MILDAFKQRLRVALVRPAPAGRDVESARQHAADLTADGSWADVDYFRSDRAGWGASVHLERVAQIARARVRCGGEFDDVLAQALDCWLARDLPSPNDWQHQIGVPRLVGLTAFLCEDALSTGARGKVSEILARARWARWQRGAWTDWHGSNLVAVAFNVLLRGCLEGVAEWCQEAFERLHAEVRVAPAGEDGIQADMSFHQEASGAPSDRHGLAFSENCARFLILGHGTAWQAPAACLNLFASFLLDGQQWMIRRGFFDRGIVGTDAGRSPAALDDLAAAVEEMAALGVTPRRAEMAAFARRLRVGSEPAVSGHRHFWRADLAVHQRPAFYTSVRLTAGPGQPADGLTCILRDGDEYDGTDAVCDRRRLPGTTSLQTAPDSEHEAQAGDRRAYAGGVTDGEHGVTVVELSRGGVRGRKAWFQFDDAMVCLGTGIGCEEAAAPVFTSLNQCRSRGTATAHGKGGETHVLVPGRSYDLSAAYRLEHDGIVYHFPEPMAVRARVSPQDGRQADPGREAGEVFSVWIDHGVQPRHESYAYTILSAAETDGRRAIEHEISQIKILANSPTRQAVWHHELRLVGIVFWEAGVVELPGGGRVAVNRPCVLLGQDRRPDGMRLSIANPAPEDATIHVEYANRCLCFNLPAGPRGGQSVTRAL